MTPSPLCGGGWPLREQWSGEGSDGAGEFKPEPRLDGLQHRAEVHQHKVVRKAKDLEALGFQPSITLCITLTALVRLMRLAIQFDDQTRGGTQEIGDVGGDRRLPPELEAMEAARADLLPE